MSDDQHTLLLRLVGPLQAWGTRSHFQDRDSESEPSKSGVLGLCAAALGIDRAEPITHLSALQFGVRIDREGIVQTDYHTATLKAGKKSNTDVTHRVHLSDAAFWAGLCGEKAVLEKIHAALKNPHWPLFLGRKSFQASLPIWSESEKLGVQKGGLLDVLRRAPSLRSEHQLLQFAELDRDSVNKNELREALHCDPASRSEEQNALLQTLAAQVPYRFVVDRASLTDFFNATDTTRSEEQRAIREATLSPAVRRDDPIGPFSERRYALRDVKILSEMLSDLEVLTCTCHV